MSKSKASSGKRGGGSLERMVRPLRFMEIYYAVNPQEPPNNWRPEEKRHVVSVVNKTKCVVETLRAMSFFPGDWTPAEHKAIKRALWPNVPVSDGGGR